MDDIRLSPQAVWTPDVELYNSRERRLLSSELTDRLVLERSGRMVWVPPNLLTAACSLDTTWFPFDEQRCDFKFGSWTYNGFKLDLQLVRERVRCPAYLETLQKSDQVDTSSYQTGSGTGSYWAAAQPGMRLSTSVVLSLTLVARQGQGRL